MAIPEMSQNRLKDLVNNNPALVVLFYANWSGSCLLLLSFLEQIAAEHTDLAKYFTINADKSRDLINEYYINIIPTILIFKEGHVLKSLQGIISKTLLKKEIEKLI